MKRIVPVWLAALLAAGMLTGCVVAPGPLPPLVEFEDEPYYYQGGYHYYYRDHAWYYSRSRGGPWKALPRDRYPKETRFRGGHEGWEHEHDRD